MKQDPQKTYITIKALKYGNRPHYEWQSLLLEQTDTHLFVLSERGRALQHHTKNAVFTIDNWSIEFFPFNAWFTVSADIKDGQINQYYCNINQPATELAKGTVAFVDLDLDLICRDGIWSIVDEDELADNAVAFNYPEPLVARVWEEMRSLQERIAQRQFPFDGSIEQWISFIPQQEN